MITKVRRIKAIISIMILFAILVFPIHVDATLNLTSETVQVSQPTDTGPSIDERLFELPWVTRYMNVDWSQAGIEGINTDVSSKEPRDPVHFKDSKNQPDTDLNYTVENGGIFILNEVNLLEEEQKKNTILEQLFPDSSDMVVIASDPGGYDHEATPLTPAKDGHWFIKTGYSKQTFKFNAQHPGFFGGYYKVHVKLTRDTDIYSRVFKVFLDGSEIYSAVIGSSGFHGDVTTPFIWWHGIHTISLQINWCGWKEHQWRTDYFWVYDEYGTPQDITSESYPADITAPKFEYRIRGGDDMKLDLTINHGANPGTWGAPFAMYVYLDDQLKQTLYVPNGEWSYEIDLGDKTYDSIHTLKLTYDDAVESPGYRRIAVNQPHHDGGWVEVDYFTGHAPSSSDLQYLESYYIVHGYNRADFFLSSQISGSDYTNYQNLDMSSGTSSAGWVYLRDKYFSNKNNVPKYEWMLFAHYVYKDGQKWSGVLGVHYGAYQTGGILMHDQIMIEYASQPNAPTIAAFRRTLGMHEYGHHIQIIDRLPGGGEDYCDNVYCCMHKAYVVAGYNVNEAPWYCAHHWSLNDFPGW